MGSFADVSSLPPSLERKTYPKDTLMNGKGQLPPTPPQVLRSIDEYDSMQVAQLGMIGKVPFTAFSLDNRFSTCLYIPRGYASLRRLPLIVLMHSSDRDSAELRNAFIDFAEAHGCAILAPLFPQGIIDPDEHDNYKKLKYKDIRFDLILLGMMDEVRQRWPKVLTERVFLYGFSGGGQFVHRFTYLHPDRLESVVIGAPGSVTPLDWNRRYPRGLQDIQNVFGIYWNQEAFKRLNVLMLVGSLDTSVSHLLARGSKPEECKSRIETLTDLESSWRSYGVSTRLRLVPGVRHDGSGVNKPVQDFFSEQLALLHID